MQIGDTIKLVRNSGCVFRVKISEIDGRFVVGDYWYREYFFTWTFCGSGIFDWQSTKSIKVVKRNAIKVVKHLGHPKTPIFKTLACDLPKNQNKL